MSSEYKTIDDQVGLIGGTVLLMGTVIGIMTFVLPGELIGEAGPSITLALVLTAIPMVFAVLLLLQLGGAIPVAGGIYVYASRLVGPYWGFLAIWLMVPAIWSVLLFTAYGFADFTLFLLPFDVPHSLLMALVLVTFLTLNLLGITLVTQVQLVMVAGLITGMVAFILTGLPNVDPANFTPLLEDGADPGGFEGFLIALVALYIPFQGFTMIIELGEELENPIKNIPRVLGLGMLFSVLLTLGLVVVFTGLAPWDQLVHEEAGVAAAAGDFIHPGIGTAVAVAAILGAFTSLNALITSYSRTIMRAARDETVPGHLAAIHPRLNVPHRAIVLLGLPPILFAPFSPGPVTLSIFLALILLFANMVSGVALWRLPKRFPLRYEHSFYRLPLPLLKVTAVSVAFFSSFFWLAMLTELPEIVVVIVALILLGYVVYRIRVHRYAERGIDLKEKMGALHEHEQ